MTWPFDAGRIGAPYEEDPDLPDAADLAWQEQQDRRRQRQHTNPQPA